jgi:hypothetical protein
VVGICWNGRRQGKFGPRFQGTRPMCLLDVQCSNRRISSCWSPRGRFVTSSAETPIVCLARSIVGADSGVRSQKAGQRPRRNGLLRTYRRQVDRQNFAPLTSPEEKSDNVRPAEDPQSCVPQLSLIRKVSMRDFNWRVTSVSLSVVGPQRLTPTDRRHDGGLQFEQLDQHLVVLLRARLASVNAGPPGTQTP